MSSTEPVDYRYLLANERTFLAYVRTALALQVAGVGTIEFLAQEGDTLRLALGMVLVLGGSAVGLAGYLRWRSNDRAIRAGAEMPPPMGAPLITVIVVLVPLMFAVVLLAS